ncbi:FAD-binding and (Fe-S)-binding domain-containing protein [Amycolatopsis jejuensis]|uniref:FAD-binding and (Fe-S)-binding domain-containing protein n=1 Tax=Amycolatopsis jejuensis TaxID=330084 RepID=UPI0005241F75|nr:FAD-binding and (Fe-S)-binding domain-containing protein [Amycolatopsis jejuensis]
MTTLDDELRSCVADPSRVRSREIDRVAFAADASFYHLLPQAVVHASGADEVAKLMRTGSRLGVPLVFRAGGSSLAGQAVSDGVLVEVKRHWRDCEVLDGGARVRVQPGLTIAQVNARLKPYGRQLGPDPSSAVACTIGGMVANNSSGKSCGIVANAYRTLESLVVVLPSGTVVDTGDPDADHQLYTRERALHDGLVLLRREILDNAGFVRKIRHQFSMKNTLGYSLNAFLDHERPAELLAHLLVGSEGTLGFITEGTFRTVPILPKTATGLLLFPDLGRACAALDALRDSGAVALELLDNASLRVAAGMSDPVLARETVGPATAGLLAEWGTTDDESLRETLLQAEKALAGLPLSTPAALDASRAGHDRLWQMRSGLYTAVAGPRPTGTTPVLEDVVVPTGSTSVLCDELTGLFDRHGYDGIIFGHVKDGNIHFLVNQDFRTDTAVQQYANLTDDVVDLVLGLDGSLKAEHGTGRNMAPFLERQWGAGLTSVMRRVKQLFDPDGVLNPGVILNDDPQAHLRDLKTTTTVDEVVDRCIECGYCEPVCPSADLTLTPRQRIVVHRELERRQSDELLADYQYEGLQTCAVDGMCQQACPVDINTGDLVRQLRAESASQPAKAAWRGFASGWSGVTAAARTGIRTGHLLGGSTEALTRAGRAVLGPIPQWTSTMPTAAAKYPSGRNPPDARAVYFPACVNAMFGPDTPHEPSVVDAFLTLCERARVPVRIPDDLAGSCCGTPWHSKGMESGHRAMAERMRRRLQTWTDDGKLPAVMDASSCTHGLADLGSAVRVLDSVQFAYSELVPRLEITRPFQRVVLHPTCSLVHLGAVDTLRKLAECFADTVEIPDNWRCCAFAGDRGLLHPELTASATAAEAAEVKAASYDRYLSANRTCEMALTSATGRPYRSVLVSLEEATRPVQ